MKRILEILGATTVGVLLFSGFTFAASGGAFSPASTGDATFILHAANSVTNIDTAAGHSVVANGGTVSGGQKFTFIATVKGNGLTLTCTTHATDLATGAILASPQGQTTQTGFATVSYVLDLSTVNKNVSLSHWCVLPKKNGSVVAEVIHVTSFGN